MFAETGIQIIGKLTELGIKPAHLEKAMQLLGKEGPKTGGDGILDGALYGLIGGLAIKFIANYLTFPGYPNLVKNEPWVQRSTQMEHSQWVFSGLAGAVLVALVDWTTDRF